MKQMTASHNSSDQQELIRWDSERELLLRRYITVLHALQK